MRDRMVDGLIISPIGNDKALRKVVSQTDIPVVLIDRILGGVECDFVVLDNKAAVMEAARYLIGLGHRRIGFISGMVDSFTGRERLAGYYAALDEAGLPPDSSLVQLGNFPDDGAREAALKLLTGPSPPTAILAVNNQAVLGVMKALRDLGIDCPRDISVAGFDDFPWADLVPATAHDGGTAASRKSASNRRSCCSTAWRAARQGRRAVSCCRVSLMVRESCRPPNV